MSYLLVYGLEDHTKGSFAKSLMLFISIHCRTKKYISCLSEKHAPAENFRRCFDVLKLLPDKGIRLHGWPPEAGGRGQKQGM